jgi:hypothetical protein
LERKSSFTVSIREGSSPTSRSTKHLLRPLYVLDCSIGIGPMQTLSGGPVSTPKRQSCDRCHGQKLRCPRPSNGNSGACERCIRSKAPCVYSSSLPKGRPSSDRQKRQNVNPRNVLSSSGNVKATNEGINFGVDSNSNSTIVTEMPAVAEQHLEQTTAATWDIPMTMDWMGYIDTTFPEPQNVRDTSHKILRSICVR